MTKKTKIDQICDYLSSHRDAKKSEVEEALGFEFASSVWSTARRRVGITAKGPITSFELDQADFLVKSLGVSLKEAHQTLDLVHAFILEIKDFDRGKQAIEKLMKYASTSSR